MQREYEDHRKYICKLLGSLIKSKRLSTTKSISLLANEIALSKSIWADLEKGTKDPQLTTLWRIAEALDIPLSEIIQAIEKELPPNWSFIEK